MGLQRTFIIKDAQKMIYPIRVSSDPRENPLSEPKSERMFDESGYIRG
jgi:hypothetical protein